MNILYICDEYPPGRHGGIGTAVQLLAREMARQGHHVAVAGFYDWGYGGQDTFTDEGVKVYRFRRRLSSPLLAQQDSIPVRAVYRLLRMTGIMDRDIRQGMKKFHAFLEDLVKEHKIDIVEMPDYNDYIRFCTKYVPFPKLSVPVIVKLHGSLSHVYAGNNRTLPQHMWQMEHDILQLADAVCSVSNYVAERTAGLLKYHKPVTVLYNGIDLSEIKPATVKIPGRVIFTGALSENKGIYQLMRAWNKVHAAIPGAELFVYGRGPVYRIKKLLNSASADSVKFMGHVPKAELYGELATATVAVFPSFAEAFGLAPVEAMASGTATIFTSRTAGPEVIQHQVNGLLVDPGNADEIATQICYLLQNPDICKFLAGNGMKKATTDFNIVESAQKHIGFYKTVLKR